MLATDNHLPVSLRNGAPALPPGVGRRYGHIVDEKTAQDLELALQLATVQKDWSTVARLAACLGELDREWG